MRTQVASRSALASCKKAQRRENQLFWQFIAGIVTFATEVALSTICYEAGLIPSWLMWTLMVHALITVCTPGKKLLRFWEKNR